MKSATKITTLPRPQLHDSFDLISTNFESFNKKLCSFSTPPPVEKMEGTQSVDFDSQAIAF